MTYDVSLYGNLILDNTYCVENYSHGESNICHNKSLSPGAIANVASALCRLSVATSININSIVGEDISGRYIEKWLTNLNKMRLNKVKTNLIKCLDPTSEAIIISDLQNKTRSSIVNWGACQKIKTLKDHKSKWCHILYIDKLPKLDLNSLKKLSENSIISVDMCSSNQTEEIKEKILSMLPHVDYVFASSDEGRCLTNAEEDYIVAKSIAELSRGWAIIHSPEGSFISNGSHEQTTQHKVQNKIEESVNVLGAGDNFAAAFITHKMSENNTVKESVRFAHEEATKYILNNNKD
jgi:sugar/nucleoside kinase (ribokinase family)